MQSSAQLPADICGARSGPLTAIFRKTGRIRSRPADQLVCADA
jgi:hypothetical protein